MGLTINRIDRNTPVPLYYQLKLIILNMVNNGQLKAGDAIPSEKELGKKYNLSRITVRSAIQELVQEGYLVKKRGVGTFVAGPKIRRGIDRLNSFSADMITQVISQNYFDELGLKGHRYRSGFFKNSEGQSGL